MIENLFVQTWYMPFDRGGKKFDAFLADKNSIPLRNDNVRYPYEFGGTFVAHALTSGEWYVCDKEAEGPIIDGPFNDWRTAYVVARMGV
jgi:hypothetical protein